MAVKVYEGNSSSYDNVLLDEIIPQPREYFIFASAIFEKIFNDYNKA